MVITARNSSCGKVMFSQASVILSTGGGMHGGCGRGHEWWGMCMVSGCAW